MLRPASLDNLENRHHKDVKDLCILTATATGRDVEGRCFLIEQPMVGSTNNLF